MNLILPAGRVAGQRTAERGTRFGLLDRRPLEGQIVHAKMAGAALCIHGPASRPPCICVDTFFRPPTTRGRLMRCTTLCFTALLILPVPRLHAQVPGPRDSSGVDTVTAPPGDSTASVPWQRAQQTVPEAGPLRSKSSLTFPPDSTLQAIADSGPVRRHAVEYSNGYAVRLRIHQIGSYAELPLFAGEYILGQKLLNDERLPGRPPRGLRDGHRLVATSLGVLFAINTVTGVWNLWDSRHQPEGRTLRTLHAIGMLAADAGFLYTASLAHAARRTDIGATNHRNAAIASISVATASTLMMWIFKH